MAADFRPRLLTLWAHPQPGGRQFDPDIGRYCLEAGVLLAWLDLYGPPMELDARDSLVQRDMIACGFATL